MVKTTLNMKRNCAVIASATLALLASPAVSAQYRDGVQPEEKSATQLLLDEAESSDSAIVISLEKALEIALSENVSVKVADMEIEREKYARAGTYSSLFPQIDATGSYQRTIKKQVMYMDFDMSAYTGGSSSESSEYSGDSSESDTSSSSGGGMEIGRWNTWSAGVSASMPIINAQLWESLAVSGLSVELAVEKARSSKLDMVTQVKSAYYAVLLAKESFKVYKDVYENAVANFELIEKKHDAQKASEMEYLRAKTTVSNAIPNVYNAESSIILTLWQLKAVIGIDLDTNIDVEGCLDDYTEHMFRDIHENDTLNVEHNTSMRQLAIQAEQLHKTLLMQEFACLPTLSLAFNYTYSAMANDFNFSEYQWTPYSYVGISLSIPIFAGGKRFHAIRQARIQYDEVELQKQNTERQLRISIRNYLTTMETSMKSFYAAEDAVESAQTSYDIVSASYELGRATLTDLNDAQLALVQSKLSKSQAVYNFIVAKSQLEQVLGADFLEEEN